MRRGAWFWGAVLVFFGVLFLLQNLGILSVNLWQVVWPVFLVLLGVWILFGAVLGKREIETQHVTIPMDGAERARIRVGHAAGRVRIYSGAPAENLLVGDFTGELDLHTRHDNNLLDVQMSVPSQNFLFFGPWNWGERGFDWSFGINGDVPLSLNLNTGAGEVEADLSGLKVTDLRISTSAASSVFTMPANAGQLRVDIEGAATSIRIKVPQGVAARIKNRSGIASLTVDASRFPRQGGFYLSPGFEEASNRIDLLIQIVMGSVYIG
jgi:hypothetical protein